jgi:hypothetical protein
MPYNESVLVWTIGFVAVFVAFAIYSNNKLKPIEIKNTYQIIVRK